MIMEYVPLELNTIYSGDKSVNNLHLVTFSAIPDAYGNSERRELFSFDFTRAIFSKVNWDNFHPYNLTKIAPNFKFSPAKKVRMDAEKG